MRASSSVPLPPNVRAQGRASLLEVRADARDDQTDDATVTPVRSPAGPTAWKVPRAVSSTSPTL